MDVERAVLQTIVYKNQHRFRNDKGFRDVRLVSKCVDRLYEVDLAKTVRDFLDSLPPLADIVGSDDGAIYFPTASMLSHVAGRLEGVFRLLEKLGVYCLLAGDMQLRRMRLGHVWNAAMVNVAVISKLWSLAKTFLVITDRTRTAILPLVSVLPHASGRPSSSTSEDSLMPTVADESLRSELMSIRLPDDPLPTPPDSGVGGSNTGAKIRAASHSADAGDVGVVVSREELLKPKAEEEPSINSLPCSKRRFSAVRATVDRLTTPEDIIKFTEEETRARKVSRKEAVTKRLSQEQWKLLRSHLKSAMAAAESKNERQLKRREVGAVRDTVLYWVLFPELEGERPANWEAISRALAQ